MPPHSSSWICEENRLLQVAPQPVRLAPGGFIQACCVSVEVIRARVGAARVPFWVSFIPVMKCKPTLPRARTRAALLDSLAPAPSHAPHEIGGCDPESAQRCRWRAHHTRPSFLHALPGLVGAWGEIWHGGALELSAFDRLAATARRPGGQKLCRSAIRRSERAGGGPPPARSAQCLQTRRRWGAPLAASLAVRPASLSVNQALFTDDLIVETPNLSTTY